MKLLFDENLSPHLARTLADLYSSSAHVHDCGLGNADDESIWEYARENGFTIVSKDSDFQERSVLRGNPPKFIWLRAGNCTSDEIQNLLRTSFPVITRFIQEGLESCLGNYLGTKSSAPQEPATRASASAFR